jgi:bifunctional UDP-N-acetylglucosamine pyrophosphorylase/glucosamine-1-phosphate N-acetyltransferase
MGESRSFAAVVLAAGEGKRFRSSLPKVLHMAAGKPLIGHVLSAIKACGPAETVVVASPRKDDISAAVRDAGHGDGIKYVVQDPPKGTGDAVRVGLRGLGGGADVILVVCGDTPLIRSETLRSLLDAHESGGAGVTVLTAECPAPGDLGRIVRTANGDLEAIVEARDATAPQLETTEINAGIYVFDRESLSTLLDKLSPSNAQAEYYLTDVIGLMRAEGIPVLAVRGEWTDTIGVNDRSQLAQAAAHLYERVAERWMLEGVTIVDPSSTFIDASVTIGRETTILPGTFLEGSTAIGAGAEVGPYSRITDSQIGDGAVVSFSVVRDSDIGPQASVGPYASLRPGTRLAKGAKLGTFVESKNAVLGEDSKAGHLSYLGDATVGAGVNIGAGTITCNWDGKDKHETVIDDEAYIGSDTMLVAPVHIGKRAATGAGSVVKGDVPDEALAVGVPARVVKGKGDKMSKKDT